MADGDGAAVNVDLRGVPAKINRPLNILQFDDLASDCN